MQLERSLREYVRLIEPMMPGNDVLCATAECVLGTPRRVSRPLAVYSQLLLTETKKVRGDMQQLDLLRLSAAALDESLWSALARRVAGERFEVQSWLDSSRKAFDNMITHQQPSGEFLPADPHANPETRWYEELTLLHAVSSYSIREPAEPIQRAVACSAAFHLNETQPDHATAEPWGLLAFIQYAPSLADQVLHAMSMQYPQGVGGTALLLLADVLYGLRRLISGG